MLIGIDANEANLTSRRVGVNRFALGLLWALYRKNSPHQFVIYLKNTPLPDLPKPRPGWQYRVIPFPKLWTQTRLPFDLYFHSPRPDVFFSLTHYAPRICPIPSVVSIMDLGFLKTPEQFTVKDFTQLKNWTEYSVKSATRVLAISGFTKRDIMDIYNLPSEQIDIVYPGYDASFFKATQSPQVLKKYHLQKPYFLFLSSLKPSKNVEGLIKAFAKFPDSSYQLVIAGKKAWMYDQIFALVKELKLTTRVKFTGFVADTDVPALMSQAASYILPSFFEGFGIPVVEAMACGTPVVVSKIASLPEVAGDAGIYVDPHDVDSITAGLVESVGSNKSQYRKLGLLQAKKFSWDHSADLAIDMLERSVSKTRLSVIQ